jgi:hypothetical protein
MARSGRSRSTVSRPPASFPKMNRHLVSFVVALSLALAGCGGTGSATGSASGKKTEGQLLAEVEKGPEPEAATVQKFDGLLAKLRRKCRVQSGGASLADMVVNVQEALGKHGHHESVGDVLEHMSETTSRAKQVGVTCTEVFALYLDLREHE